jgi:PAS domain S-box-containing protein
MNNGKYKYPRIQIRLFIGLLIIILSSSIINILYYRDIKKLNEVTNRIIEHPFTVSNSVLNIDIYINAIHRTMKDIVLSENEIELNNAINLVNKNEQLIYDNFEIVKEKFLGDLKFVNDAYTTFVSWKPIRDEVIDLVKNGNIDVAAKITKEKGNDHIIILLQKTYKMIDFANKKAANFNQNSMDILLKAKGNFLLFFIISSVLGIIMFVWIFYSITIPINNMIERIKDAPGDKIQGLSKNIGNHLVVLDFAISEFENREKNLEEKVNIQTSELREARNLLESSIENANIGMVTTNLEGKLLKVNNSFCDFIGYPREELLSMKFNDFTKEEDKAKGLEFVKKIIEGEIDEKSFEKAYVHKSGEILYGSVTTSLVMDSNNQPNHMFAQIRDITDQKQYEIELAHHKNELESLIKGRTRELDNKALKLEKSQQALTFLLEDVNDIKKQLEISNSKLLVVNKELESFSYSVSHDLKAPLRAVIGFSQILNEDFASQLNQESKRYIGLIKDNAENMGALINDLLSFSRMGRTELQKTKVNLHTITERVKIELQTDIHDRNITFCIEPMPLINADEKLMYHVMLNLISNAVKFTSKVENAIVELGCTSQNKQNEFYIKDNGIGFDMKYVDKIFDVFQRLHRVEDFPGTGIGLSIVQRIIHKHEGKIWVESKINKGTTFFFTI